MKFANQAASSKEKNKSLTSSQGFTLVEVLIAAMILSFGLLLVIEGMGRSQDGIRIAENMVIASQLAEEKMVISELQAKQCLKLSSAIDRGEEKLPGKIFKWEKSIKPYRHETIEDETKFNRVNVDFSWSEGGGRQGGMNIETLIFNREKMVQ